MTMEVRKMVQKPSRWIVRGVVLGCFLLIVVAGSLIGSRLFAAKSQTASHMGTPEDPDIRYVGRWDTSNSLVYNSYWPGAYFETAFTGTTVTLKLAGFSGIYVSIDHKPEIHITYLGSGGIVHPLSAPLKAGTHTIRVAVANDMDTLHFKGLTLDSGATTLAPHLSAKLLEFVGDSITVGATDTNFALSDYAWLTAEHLGVEHTQIAQGGMCLVTNVQCAGPDTTGMAQQYFKLETSYFQHSPAWDFSLYQATAVVINLGTNDQGNHVDPARFQSTYVSFLKDIRAKYPHALLFAMEPFDGAMASSIQAAVQIVSSGGDRSVQYISTDGWLESGSNDFSGDNLHPSDSGQIKAASRLEPLLATALGLA